MKKEIISSSNIPEEYPWDPPENNGFVDPHGGTHHLKLTTGRRISRSHVEIGGEYISTTRFLRENRSQRMNDRYLVVAVGSNASVEVLQNKFEQRTANGHIEAYPIIKCRIYNMAIGAMALVSKRGYIPATPITAPGAATDMWASWLTRKQFEALDSTEPGYSCKLISSSDYPIQILNDDEEPAEEPEKYYIYEADCGYLKIDDAPILFPISQENIFQKLKTSPALASHLPASYDYEILADRNEELSELFQNDNTICCEPDIKGTVKLDSSSALTYGRTISTGKDIAQSFEGEQKGRYLGRVVPSRNKMDRAGEHCIGLPTKYQKTIGNHAYICSAFDEQKNRPGLVCAVRYFPDIDNETVEVDQVLREALAINRTELIYFSRANIKSNKLVNFICPPRYVTLRTLTADYSNIEQDVALVDSLTLSFLGLKDSDFLVLEGVPDESNIVPSYRVRAVAITDSVQERRTTIYGGGISDLFGDPETAFGNYPDILPIMIDQSVRDELGQGENLLIPLRARASRRTLFLAELRELFLVMLIAFIGIITMVDSQLTFWILLTLLISGSLILSLFRMRSTVGGVRRKICVTRASNTKVHK
ncbi:MAG: hypothetical protein KIA12_06535 [Varibaculum cambriense]|uniref:hypothetical protein n=1 Tax=Varibaculum cambriense TaxID=184870 RepID=UPI00241E9BF2|nr:hypothetical protein [Varibaculum cambriense]MBS5973135.1 hypothetical protein [Varibaculum cambriense]